MAPKSLQGVEGLAKWLADQKTLENLISKRINKLKAKPAIPINLPRVLNKKYTKLEKFHDLKLELELDVMAWKITYEIRGRRMLNGSLNDDLEVFWKRRNEILGTLVGLNKDIKGLRKVWCTEDDGTVFEDADRMGNVEGYQRM